MILITDATSDYVLTNRGSRAMPIERIAGRRPSGWQTSDERVIDSALTSDDSTPAEAVNGDERLHTRDIAEA
ncbi:MAG: hypothetical protein KC502_23945 [Myxococcales bacterium]|nr:hypothetical protein [Myxococcales bacterium]